MPSRKRAGKGKDAKDDEKSASVTLKSEPHCPSTEEQLNNSFLISEEPRRGVKNRKSKNTGKLARMLELPLEVFTEVSPAHRF